MKKRTAKTVDQVRAWIESTPHHIAESVGGKGWIPLPDHPNGGVWDAPTHLVLRGYHDQLRIPVDIVKQCHMNPAGDPFDTRMYRWDFEKEKKVLFGEYVEPRDVRVQINGYVVKEGLRILCYDNRGQYTGHMVEGNNEEGPAQIFVECTIREGKRGIGRGLEFVEIPDLTFAEQETARHR